MQEHQLKLASEPFEAIASGRKTIESRLHDEKRQNIKVNDIIKFTNSDNPSQSVRAKVTGLLHYRTFKDMFANNYPAKFGGESPEWLLRQISRFYSESEQEQYGVVGIEFILV